MNSAKQKLSAGKLVQCMGVRQARCSNACAIVHVQQATARSTAAF